MIQAKQMKGGETILKGEFTVSRNQRIGTDRDPAFMGDGYCDLILLMVDVDEIELYERFTVKDLKLVKKVRTVIAFDLSPFFDPDGILGFAFHFSFLLLCFLFAFRQPWRSTGERHISQTKEEQEKKRKSLKKQSGVSDRQYVVRLISTVYCSVESPSRRQRKNTLQE